MKRIPAARYSLLSAATAVLFSTAASADTATAETAPAETAAAETAEAEEAGNAQLAQAATAEEGEGEGEGEAATGEATESDASETASGEVTEEKKKPKGKEHAEEAQKANPALAAGGVIAGASSFPLGVMATLNNQIGSGSFAPGYANNGSLQTSLSVRPYYRVQKFFDWQPNMMVNASLTTSIEWLSSFTGSGMGPVDRQIRLSDFSVGLILPGLIRESFTGISITPVLRATLPLSIASRYQNRAVGFGGGAQVGWNTGLPWNLGAVGLQYTPSASAWTFTQNSATLPCGEDVPVGLPFLGTTNPADGMTDYAPAVARPEEYIDDAGNCRIRGRQGIGGVSNTGVAFWSHGDPMGGSHTVAVVAGLQHMFLRPLEDKPELRSQWATPQSYVNFQEFSFGDISYTYNLPIDTNVSITAGLTSFQPAFDSLGVPRFPFFDLNMFANHSGDGSWVPTFQGSNNLSAGYLTLTVGI